MTSLRGSLLQSHMCVHNCNLSDITHACWSRVLSVSTVGVTLRVWGSWPRMSAEDLNCYRQGVAERQVISVYHLAIPHRLHTCLIDDSWDIASSFVLGSRVFGRMLVLLIFLCTADTNLQKRWLMTSRAYFLIQSDGRLSVGFERVCDTVSAVNLSTLSTNQLPNIFVAWTNTGWPR